MAFSSRRIIVALVASALAIFGHAGPAAAANDDTNVRSFPGCPLLIERFSGDCVVQLQRALNSVNSAYGLTEDGQFGPMTRIAVLDFQGRNRLGADGNVGGITADELLRQLPKPLPPSCLDQGKITGPNGDCVSDGVVGGGKPLGTCLKEAVISEAQQQALERAFTTGKFSSWKAALPKLHKIAPGLSAFEAFKCGWWDTPAG